MTIQSRIRVPKAGELVAGRLRRQIILGELKEGEALPSETALMEHYGVSRPTLREAFRVLEAEGLISIHRGARGGARVHVPDVSTCAKYAGVMLQYRGTTLADVYQARSILESRAAGLLAARRTRTEIDALEEALAESREAAKDPPRFVHVDEKFHLLVVELGGNETLALLVRMLYHIIATANATVTALDTHPPEKGLSLARRAHRMHERLVSLVRDGDPVQAENLWRKHLDGIAKMLTEDMDVQTVLDLLS